MAQIQPLASSIIHISQTNGQRMNFGQLQDSYIQDQIDHRQYDLISMINDTRRIRIMSYNVHYWKDTRDVKIHFSEMMEVIRKLDPDILILQEVSLSTVPRDLIYTTLISLGYNMQNILFCGASRIYEGPFGNLIATKYPIINSYNIQLYKYVEGRCSVVADIKLPDDKIIRVYGFQDRKSVV